MDPHRGLGRRLRALAGIREEILDWVPEERPRYTRLGAIIFNTGLLAGVSLLVALAGMVAVPWILLLPAAALWAYVIISFDGWLIASTHGMLGAGKARVFLPRLVISLLMGAVIAEPLLLWIFQPAIHKEVLDGRQHELSSYESQYRNCNPAGAPALQTPGCAEFQLTIANSPDAAQQELEKAVKNRDAAKAEYDTLYAKWDGLEKLARGECSGSAGEGLTGVAGDGPECDRNRDVADRFRTDNQLEKRQADLTAANANIDGLTAKLGSAQQTAGQQISAAIKAKVDSMREHQGVIGILDEDEALGRLSDRSTMVFAAEWLVRLLLIAIDCMPVLTKLMSGSTAYDVLVSRQVEVARRLHDKHVTLRERQDTADNDVWLQRTEYNLRTRIDSIEEADRSARARRESDLDAEIDRLAAKLRNQQ
ncbi:hypothetical protein DV20_18775 [Amycolatopsis rifamycinica]|uniref:DUF4407 domain-containing protein n=1 Tax=Amycolatopsis rifamycinica TaxID=287986 RepID=A0A066U957_9PSEU|nr:hypothetical protein DV20_18775 [Amycolatopsis rifamycinica]